MSKRFSYYRRSKAGPWAVEVMVFIDEGSTTHQTRWFSPRDFDTETEAQAWAEAWFGAH